MNLPLTILVAERKVSKVLRIIKALEPLFPEVKLSPWETFWWAMHYGRLLSLLEDTLTTRSRRIKILEVGMGYGVLATCASNYGSVTAIEHPSRDYMNKQAYLNFFLKRNIKITAADITEGIPFKSGSFDVVLFCDVWEHLDPQILPHVVKELRRVLNPEGYIIISTPNLARFDNRLKFLFGKSPNPPFPTPLYGRTYGHVREYTLGEITSFLKQYGFDIVKTEVRLLPVFEQLNSGKLLTLCTIKALHYSFKDEIYLLIRA